MYKAIALTLGVALAGLAPAAAEDERHAWDRNRDNRITSQEARDLDDGLFEDWDGDNDDIIETPELNAGIFDTLDRNRSGFLGENELEDLDGWGVDSDFNAWDTNDDNLIARNEFDTRLGRDGMFNTWDRDRSGGLNDRELSEGLFGLWDADRSGYLAGEEFDDLGDAGLFDV